MRANLRRLSELPAAESLKRDYLQRVDLSWIYHDSALEGVVYQNSELILAMRGDAAPDPTLVSTFDEIRQNRAAVELVKEMSKQEKLRIDFDTLTAIYEKLAPDEMEGKKVPTYRKDMPIHRLYFHEIATPDKIVPKLKAFFQWMNAPDTKKSTHVVRLAAKAHFHLLHIYPFPKHSGRIARMVMNLILLQDDYPPAVIHSTERQRYYDALKTNDNALANVVREALVSSMETGTRFFEAALPPPPPPPSRKIARPKPRAVSTKPPPPRILRPMVRPSAKQRRTGPIVPKTSGPLPKAFVSKSSAPNREPLMRLPIAVPAPTPAKTDAPAKASKAVPAKAAVPTKAVPTKVVPSKAEPSKAVPSKAEPSKAEPTKAEPTKAEPVKAKPTTTATLSKTSKPAKKVSTAAKAPVAKNAPIKKVAKKAPAKAPIKKVAKKAPAKAAIKKVAKKAPIKKVAKKAPAKAKRK